MSGKPAITCSTTAELCDPLRRERLLAMLSPDENARFRRFDSQAAGDLFLLARGLLRESLSRHADVAPSEWRFQTGEHGRPEIASPTSRLRFNVSHTQDLAVCAVTKRHAVGIDVEHVLRQRPAGLADRFFSARERRDLEDLSDSAQQQTRFFEYWTLKEAYLKARGCGLALPLDGLTFYRAEDQRWNVEFGSSIDDDPSRWRFESWQIGRVHQAALAVAVDEPPG